MRASERSQSVTCPDSQFSDKHELLAIGPWSNVTERSSLTGARLLSDQGPRGLLSDRSVFQPFPGRV